MATMRTTTLALLAAAALIATSAAAGTLHTGRMDQQLPYSLCPGQGIPPHFEPGQWYGDARCLTPPANKL